jgi:RNA polymerase sigma-70 factor (ECF subfamily)
MNLNNLSPPDGSGELPEATVGSEQVLLEQSRAGDQEAFATLVRAHQRRVFNVAYRMVLNYEEAIEITQEVFLLAWQNLATFRGDARLSTWLYRITHNCCLRVLDQRRRDHAALAAAQAEEARQRAGSSEQLLLDARERLRMIQQFIADLPPKYRIVLILRHLQDQSYEEMAETLQVPIGTIKTHLFRARELLRERLRGLERVRDELTARVQKRDILPATRSAGVHSNGHGNQHVISDGHERDGERGGTR